MARSIHTTWKDYWEKQRYQYSDQQQQARELKEMRKALSRKRAIKKQRKAERKAAALDLPPPPTVSSESLQIVVQDQVEYVHYPLTADDVRAVLEVLPKGIADGLTSITFTLGKADMKEKNLHNPDPPVDPYTGRISYEGYIPGIFSPPILGAYNYESKRIFIYAYVYDRHTLQNPILAFYLKLQMLNTFLHELAHHEDNQHRIASGRWLGSYDTRVEDYAYQRQAALVSKALMDALHERYQPELTNLNTSIETHGGIRIPIEEIIKGGLIFTVTEAVEQLFGDISEGTSPTRTKYNFANNLHYTGYYERALSILDAILLEDPNNLEAKVLIADIYCHQKDYKRAETVAQEVLVEDPENVAAFCILADIFFEENRWKGLVANMHKAQKIITPEMGYRFLWYLEKHLLAHLFLGNYDQAKQVFTEYPTSIANERRQKAIEALLLLATGSYADARTLSSSILTGQYKHQHVAKAIAKGVFNVASAYLDKTDSIWKFKSRESSILRRSKIDQLPFMSVI